MHNKKGMMSNIVKAIPVLIIAGILFYILSLIFSGSGSAVDREVCRDWVLLKAQSKILGRPLVGENTPCKTDIIEIKKTDEYEIKQDIANEMYDCWYQFGGGNQDFLGDWDWFKGNNWCFICSKIDFSEKVQNEVPEIIDFSDFLATEPMPLYEEKTFFEYFYGVEGEISIDDFPVNLDTSTPLYIVFFADKKATTANYIRGTIPTLAVPIGACVVSVVAAVVSGGTLSPVAGVVCSKAGIITAAVVGTAAGGVYMVSHKDHFASSLYVGNSEEIIGYCNQ